MIELAAEAYRYIYLAWRVLEIRPLRGLVLSAVD